jgi:tetratricopeptide (TPR) repeat protein
MFDANVKRLVTVAAALLMVSAGAASTARATPLTEVEPAVLRLADSNSLLGSYLAGRVARYLRDGDQAVAYYQRALEKDPANPAIIEEAFQLELANGNFENAKRLAQQIVRAKKDDRIARIFLGLDAFRRKDYARADQHFSIAGKATPGEPTLTLARAWVALADNKPQKAFLILQSLGKAEWAEHFAAVHRAFMADLARRRKTAAEAYAAVYEKNKTNARIVEAYARHLAHWGNTARAIEILKERDPSPNSMAGALLAELQAGGKPKLLAATVKEGMAEVFLGIGQILVSNNGVDAAQIYMRLALFADPSSMIAQFELGEVYGQIEKYDKAIEILGAIPDDTPIALSVQIRKALHLNASDRLDEALAVLERLQAQYPDEVQIPQTMGNIESGRKNYEAAIPHYSRAIGLVRMPEKRHWPLYYARAVAYERTKQWPSAEADFKIALELDGEQALVLNYLGYSWLDQGMHLDEAMELIRKAVKLRPNDGYIIDSLGWGYYLRGDYDTALKHLERAVELRPEDPTLNDHLGDAYWKVGRKLEAQFQWAQALTLNPEPEDAAKIKAKVKNGLVEETSTHAKANGKTEATRTSNP